MSKTQPVRTDDGMALTVPPVYQAGYEEARKLNPGLAAKYVQDTTKTDPAADAVIESPSAHDHSKIHHFIKASMEKNEKVLAETPSLLHEFFDDIEPMPSWFDPTTVLSGHVAFHAYSDLFIPVFLVATVQNASTQIAKAFYATGRVVSGCGPRRIRQNIRHFIEIVLPGSMERYGGAWNP